jgi:hypothetical protein
MYGIPTLVTEKAEQPLKDVPIVASLRIGVTKDNTVLKEFCTRASVDWVVTDGGRAPYQRPDTGTGRFVLYGENGERFTELMPGQIVEFSLIQGDIEMHVCAHRITQIDRGLSWRTINGTRTPFVTTTLLTAGPLERFARIKIKKLSGDTWPEEKDDARAARLLAFVDSAVPAGFSFTAKDSDPALALVADPSMLSFNDAGQPRHWGDETDDLTNAWRIVPSTNVNTKAERDTVPVGAALRSYRPHMVNGPTVKGHIYVTGNTQIKVGVLHGVTAAQCYATPTALNEAAWTTINGTNVRHNFTLTLPATTRWVRLVCLFQNATGAVGVERFWASTDPVAIGRVTLRNLPDADIENKPAGDALRVLEQSAHSAFFETRRGYLTYMNFDRLNALGQFTQPVQCVLGGCDVLSDVQSSVRSSERVNVLRVGYFDHPSKEERTLVVTDPTSVATVGMYEQTTGGDVVIVSKSINSAAASPRILASDIMANIGNATLDVPSKEMRATGKAAEPRERVEKITTVPFHLLKPHQVKELMQLAPMACVRIDNAPRGFPHSSIGQWVGAVLGSELRGSSNRATKDGQRTVNVSMTLNVIDMTKVSESPAVTVTADRTSVFVGVPVTLSYRPAVQGEDAPIGTTYQWQYRVGAGSWMDYPSSANPLTWTPTAAGTAEIRVRLTTPDGATFDSVPVTITAKANVYTTRVLLSAPGGILSGTTASMLTEIDEDTSVASYEWWYQAPGQVWTKWTPTTANIQWPANTPGVWQWKAVAVHYDGHRVESNVERVWVAQSFTASASHPTVPAGDVITLTASLVPYDHGATALGWERQDGTGPWQRLDITANPYAFTMPVGGKDIRFRWLEEFPDGTILYSTVVTVNASEVEPPPPVKPETRTIQITASSSRSYVSSGALRFEAAYSKLYHGWWSTTNGQQKGVLIFNIPAEVVTAQRITGARLRLTRTTGGSAGSNQMRVGVHTSASPQTTYGAVTGKEEGLQTVAGPANTTETTAWATLTSAVYEKLRTAKGLILGPTTSNAQSNYMVFHGVGGAGGEAEVTAAKKPVLEITYEVLV